MYCLLLLIFERKLDIRSSLNENHKIYPESIYKLKGNKKLNRSFRDKANY